MPKLKEKIIKNTSSDTFARQSAFYSTAIIMSGALLFMYLLLIKTPTDTLIGVSLIIALVTYTINKTVSDKLYTIYSAICDREAVERREEWSKIWDNCSEKFGVDETDDPIEKRKRLNQTHDMATLEANKLRK